MSPHGSVGTGLPLPTRIPVPNAHSQVVIIPYYRYDEGMTVTTEHENCPDCDDLMWELIDGFSNNDEDEQYIAEAYLAWGTHSATAR